MIKFKKIFKSKKWLNWTNIHLKDNINKIFIFILTHILKVKLKSKCIKKIVPLYIDINYKKI